MNIFTSVVSYDNDTSVAHSYYIKPMIKSLMLSNSDNEINLYIICDPISKSIVQDFLKNDCNLKAKVHIKYVDNTLFEKYGRDIRHESWQAAIYYKIFISFLFTNIDKFFWLDYDTLITIDLNELYNTDISEVNVYGFSDIELMENNTPFINTGVVLFNSKKFRDDFTLENVIAIFKEALFTSEIPFLLLNTKIKLENNIFYNYPGILNRHFHVLPSCDDTKSVLLYAARFSKIIHFYVKDTDNKGEILMYLFEGNSFLKSHKNELLPYLKNVFNFLS